MEFEWDEHNTAHIAEHGLTRRDIEEALLGRLARLRIETINGEERISQLGRTSKGRILYLVVTRRGNKTRPVTAFPAKRAFAGLYLARYGDRS